uniref:C-type lectin domain-containing protein n=1 Tax=Poecilia reticulata TaxID=8081 RepID=A0A3P9N7J7_POERE
MSFHSTFYKLTWIISLYQILKWVFPEERSVSALPVFCPAGWRRFGCSCYLLSSSMSSWEGSRAQCLLTGEFLDQLGAQLKVWIGLKEASRGSGWKWTDGSSPGVTFWTRQTSWTSRTQSCAAFNRGSRSWSEEWCSQLLRWVCEKKASTSGRLQ